MTKGNTLGQLVKAAREQKGLRAEELADLLKMKGHAYRRYERDEVPMRATTFIEIAKVLDISLDELAGFKELSKDDEKIIYQKIPSKKGTKIIFEVE